MTEVWISTDRSFRDNLWNRHKREAKVTKESQKQ